MTRDGINQLVEWQPNEALADVPHVSPDLHRGAMRHVAAAVTIITTRDHEQPIGLTATAVCSVTGPGLPSVPALFTATSRRPK